MDGSGCPVTPGVAVDTPVTFGVGDEGAARVAGLGLALGRGLGLALGLGLGLGLALGFGLGLGS